MLKNLSLFSELWKWFHIVFSQQCNISEKLQNSGLLKTWNAYPNDKNVQKSGSGSTSVVTGCVADHDVNVSSTVQK